MRAQFIVVNTSVLPEIFEKVLEVKKLVADHSEKSFDLQSKSSLFNNLYGFQTC